MWKFYFLRKIYSFLYSLALQNPNIFEVAIFKSKFKPVERVEDEDLSDEIGRVIDFVNHECKGE